MYKKINSRNGKPKLHNQKIKNKEVTSAHILHYIYLYSKST